MKIYMSDRGERVIRFIETLRIPEGMHVGQPFVLRDWQKEIIQEVYGPVDEYGHRIVRKAIFSVGKKNGKTPLVSGIGLSHLCGPEAKRNEQLYSAAYEREQAGITFRYMREMVELDEELSRDLNVKATTKEIVSPLGSVFKALSSEVKGKHGIGPALLIFDELAQFGADREFYDTLAQGRGAHEEPLMWIISTQAADDKALLSQEIDYGLKVMRGEIDDPTVKCWLYTTPIEISLRDLDEDALRASNPALGDFLSAADLAEALRTAQNMPSAEANVRNLRLNQRIDSTQRAIPPDLWKACGDAPDLDAFESFPVHGGLDLSGKNDLTALILVARDDAGLVHVRPYFWTPGDNLRDREDRDRVPYCTWRDQGYLIAKPGRTIDYGWVAQQLGEIHAETPIVSLRFDRWRIDDLKRELDALGIDAWVDRKTGGDDPIPGGIRLVPHGQGFQDMSPAVEHLEDAIAEGKLRHGMHPVLTMCASNAVYMRDPTGARKFAKDRSTGRIDGIVALAMALTGLATDVPPESREITQGFVFLDGEA